jgi:hypothetical protein
MQVGALMLILMFHSRSGCGYDAEMQIEAREIKLNVAVCH